MKNLKNLVSLENLKNLKNSKNLENLENSKNLDNIKNYKNLENLKNLIFGKLKKFRQLNSSYFDKRQIKVRVIRKEVGWSWRAAYRSDKCVSRSLLFPRSSKLESVFRKKMCWCRQAACEDHNRVSRCLRCRFSLKILGKIVVYPPAEIPGRIFSEAEQSSLEWVCGWAGGWPDWLILTRF